MGYVLSGDTIDSNNPFMTAGEVNTYQRHCDCWARCGRWRFIHSIHVIAKPTFMDKTALVGVG
ncbi:MAG: hypothetical protein ACI8XX_001090 [Polaribacter sp.]|jgi:hypothetical protein